MKIVNELKRKKLIRDYAIGGGIGTIFYTEPFFTYDLDIFVVIPKEKKGKIDLLSDVFEYLKNKGYKWKGEHIIIEGIPVQFIVCDEMEEEGVREAVVKYVGRVKTKVFSPEYLIAMLLKSGRKKDIEKIRKLFEETQVNRLKLRKILRKFNLSEKLRKFKDNFKR